MKKRRLGNLWDISELALGGGGLGQVWGKTDRAEAIATAREALDLGITFFDMAPMYGKGEAEAVMGEAFEGKLPDDIRVTTKCMVGELDADEMEGKLEKSIVRSLASMKLEKVDLFFLHSNIIPDDYMMKEASEVQHLFCVTWSRYLDSFLPAVEKLKAKGLIGDWGITGSGLPRTIMDALHHDEKPAAVQAIANLMDSPGGMRRYEEPPEPRNIIRTAVNNDIGVMGIRAVQAGALTSKIDRLMDANDPEMLDYIRAQPWRDLCKELGEDPALLAHRYALAMDGVGAVVLGVKNRSELRDVVEAVNKGPLDAVIISKINALRLNFYRPKIPMET